MSNPDLENVRIVIDRALNGINLVPPAERAAIYDGIADCLQQISPEHSKAASDAADALNEAQCGQKLFRMLWAQKPE